MRRLLFAIASVLLSTALSSAQEQQKQSPYHGFTGTVHQFGFVGTTSRTSNPNPPVEGSRRAYTDFGLGAVYNLHDYVTPQFAVELITNISVASVKYLPAKESGSDRLKFVFPVDVRACLGPSEDFQTYVGGGLQWSALGESIHQFSGNAAAGFNILGPQRYMVHFNIGAKFHFPIAGNEQGFTEPSQIVDMTRDKACVVLSGNVTVDLDRRKRALVMLGYEYPLGNPKSTYADGTVDNRFFSQTQMLALSLLFHLGGTR